MSQVVGIFQDSFRELRSRSLFWIAIAISVLVSVLLFGLIGFNESGWQILWFTTNESRTLREGSPGARDLLSWLFGGALMWWWLTWGAIVIALIVSASTIPEFVSGGHIDLVLSKPIGRIRLYLLKVLSALLFTLLQVLVCVSLAYLIVGLRFGIWFHSAWLAVPLVTLQYFYLFTFMSMVGLITRSTLASLLAVLIFWAFVSIVQFASNQVDSQVAQAQSIVQKADTRISVVRQRAATDGRELTISERSQIESIERQAEPMRKIRDAIRPWQRPLHMIEFLVPKTGDIQKILADHLDAPTFNELVLRLQGFDPEMMAQMSGMNDAEQFRDAQEAGAVGSRAARSVSAQASIASSLAVTAVFLSLSLLIFARRDF